MLCLILLGIKLIEKWTTFLWGAEKLLFNRFSVRYLFDGADLLLLLGFLLIGVPVILIAYFRSNDNEH